MINNILSTAGSRLIAGFILLGILFLHTNFLGASILGEITLFKIALTINNLIAAVCCGPAIVYVCTKFKPSEIFIPAFLWIILISIGSTLIQQALGSFPAEYSAWLIACSFLFALQVFYENILLSRERILIYNTSALVHHIILVTLTLVLLDVYPVISAYNFIYALFGALCLNLVFLVASTWRIMNYPKMKMNTAVFGLLFSSGLMTQVTNFIQTLNYRVSVYFLFQHWGKTAVGYFGACLQLAEAIWIIGKSLSLVQYARLVSLTDKMYQIRFSLLFAKICLFLTAVASVILLIIPESWLIQILGNEFHGVKHYLALLLPGIVCFSVVLVLASFYSARGKFYVNTLGSALSLCCIGICGYLYIPDYGMQAAALVYSGGLTVLMLFYVVTFTIGNRIGPLRLLPNRSDFEQIRQILRDYKLKKWS